MSISSLNEVAMPFVEKRCSRFVVFDDYICDPQGDRLGATEALLSWFIRNKTVKRD